MSDKPRHVTTDFERHSGTEKMSITREFLQFLGHNKKWWLLPIVVTILLLGALVFLAGTGAAPFIYTLF